MLYIYWKYNIYLEFAGRMVEGFRKWFEFRRKKWRSFNFNCRHQGSKENEEKNQKKFCKYMHKIIWILTNNIYLLYFKNFKMADMRKFVNKYYLSKCPGSTCYIYWFLARLWHKKNQMYMVLWRNQFFSYKCNYS